MPDFPVLGIIGGSGVYKMDALKDIKEISVSTPFGDPSSPIVTGMISGKRVAFLARHGIGHHISPTEVNYRANIYALKSLGIKRVISISACGSLRDDYVPGDIVIPDQLVDFTRNRVRSFFGEGIVVHVGTADPYCDDLNQNLYRAVHNVGGTAHLGGTSITIEGPRFSTRAESNMFRQLGMSIIGMTACPEAFLAREAEMCYATMAHVTDFDVWHVSEEPVTVEMVINTLNKNTETAQRAIENTITMLEDEFDCGCNHSLGSAIITDRKIIPAVTRKKLGIFLDKYLAA
jgi:5'-methylthioadenosine phosphorylase